MGAPWMSPAQRIRASDAERAATTTVLQAAASEGRLTLEEFSERSGRACAAVTRDELAALVADLPVAPLYWASPAPYPAAPPQVSPVPLLALVFGVLGIPSLSCMPLGAAVGVMGIVLGVIGLGQIRRGAPGSRAMALTGIVCGSIAVVLQIAVAVLLSLLSG